MMGRTQGILLALGISGVRSDSISPSLMKCQNVAGLLSGVEYGLRMFKVFGPGKATPYTKDVVPTLKGIRAVLQNESGVGKPLNRQLHETVDYFRNVVKPNLEKDSHQRVEEGVSVLVDLAIDFFCWR